MYITVINDCLCANARGRQETRLNSLFNSPVNFLGVTSDLEAGGNLIDILDAGCGKDGIILVNVAPRNNAGKKHKNGAPFGYFFYKKTLVMASIDGFVLSFIKKLNITKEINVLDLEKTVIKFAKNQADKIISTQFRSYEFLPLAAKWIKTGKKTISNKYSVANITDLPPTIWWIDNFGNCKTTLLKEELTAEIKNKLSAKIPEIKFLNKLKDVPNNSIACIEGSSGLDNKKFLEIIVQGGSATKKTKLGIGQNLLV